MNAPTATDQVPMEGSAAPAKESSARKLILLAVAVLLIIFTYTVVADRFTPYSSSARVDTFLVQVAPEVAGKVIAVNVRENATVKKGQPLFQIDSGPYEIALQAAEANLSAAIQDAEVSAAEVVASRASLRKQQVDLEANRQLGRIVTDLVAEKALPVTNAIRSGAETGKTQADVAKAKADLQRAQANLGDSGLKNAKVRQARSAVDQARLDLRNTSVVAAEDGIVTNLRLSAGQFVTKGQPLLSFLEDGPRWIAANLRENQLGNVRTGDEALVALDVLPGRLFHARVQSVGWGVTQGAEAPTGQLPDVPPEQGWLREPQRFPVRIQLLPEQTSDVGTGAERSGAQANVIIFTSRKSFLNPIGRIWIRAIALISYLQ